jgi:hypothetical protein|tara:strand:- start:411 stop:767 length:357 start_codon:yes stop_codon:yes gene_type:complete
MTVPIYASAQHKVIVEKFLNMNMEFAKEVSTKSKYNNYLEVVKMIIEYHNNYGKSVLQNKYDDWMLVLPINLTVATSGFFAGVETKGNRASVNAYRTILAELVYDVIDRLERIEKIND